MQTRTAQELLNEIYFKRKVYRRKNGTFVVAKYYSSKLWNLFDWYIVEVSSFPGDKALERLENMTKLFWVDKLHWWW